MSVRAAARRTLLSGLLLALIAVLFPVAHASADSSTASASTPAPQPIPQNLTPPTANGSDKVTFSVVPANTNGPDGRVSLSYNRITPGTVIEDYIGVNNFSDQPVKFTLGSADAYTNATGSLTLYADDRRSSDIGSWVTFTRNEVTIPAHARLNEPIKVTVPRNAKPGDHTGGVFAEYKIAAGTGGASNFNQDHRVGVPLYVSVPGAVAPGLSIQSLSTSYHSTLNPLGEGSATVSYTVVNTGNVNLVGTQHISVKGLFGITVASIKGPELPEVLPGKSFKVVVRVSGVFPLAWMKTKVTIQPTLTHPNNAGPTPKKIAQASKSAGFWASPILLILLILLIVAAVLGGRYWFRYRRALTDDRLFDAIEKAKRETRNQLTSTSPERPAGDA